jgi:hypothetical protein
MSSSAFAANQNPPVASFGHLPTSSPGALARLVGAFLRWQVRRLEHKIETIQPRACFLR